MPNQPFAIMDGNEAAAWVAHRVNEVIAIYPITPASPMGEWADAWSNAGQANLFGTVPRVIEMQSEGGAAGAVHGSLQAGALTTTFTASQGLLLMIPNMYKIAGELTPAVFHVAARSLATHALSIFGDHSDVMSVRGTGWAMLAASSVQEAHDFALISQAATLQTRIPFLHFFDGFRTSHELNKIRQLTLDDLKVMLDDSAIAAHRQRALDSEHPVLRGSAQNPDVFFQAREAINPFYRAAPETVQQVMDQFAQQTGRGYRLFEYQGPVDAERVLVLMGSGTGAALEAAEHLQRQGEKVGVLTVRLYRPWDTKAFLAALPATTKRIAVLDRCKEPGATGEPLYQDVVTSLAQLWREVYPEVEVPQVYGGRYGLSSKEFTPAMVVAVDRELRGPAPRQSFTVGIYDDVTHLSLEWDRDDCPESDEVKRAVFYGLGSDGTVGASKSTVKIIGEETSQFAQGYFVYDSKKAGSITVSHLRFSKHPIQSTYLIDHAAFVGCHQFNFLEKIDVLKVAAPGAIFLLNSPHDATQVWDHLPQEAQQQILDKQLRFYVIDASAVAKRVGLGNRINTVMQACFFALSELLPLDEAILAMKGAIKKAYGRRGETILRRNYEAVDQAVASLQEVAIPATADSQVKRRLPVPAEAPDFVQRVTARMIAGEGDLLPVSALPVDGTFPTGTAQYERRSIAHEIPIWDEDICIECGLCALVCPHAAIRAKAYPADQLNAAPDGYRSKDYSAFELQDHRLTIQVAPDDCTGCGVCVDVCPARSKEVVKHKAINMRPKLDHLEVERSSFEFFKRLPEMPREAVKQETVKGSQLLLPLFEYSGACAGCGETPYLKLLTQLFGDRAVVANATGCSSIFGGNLPTTPWSLGPDGRGPAWSNSLFEDNAEFGLGMRLAISHKAAYASHLLHRLVGDVSPELIRKLEESPQRTEEEIGRQRQRVADLKQILSQLNSYEAQVLLQLADFLVKRSLWIVGGDGWAYDIGFGGLDHVLASGEDVNVLVLDTAVYSNTGGQSSKATPRGAVAKFATGGKTIRKKDLGMLAVSYGNVYVAQVAMGANPAQVVRVFQEAESYAGPSLILAYSHCIAHGIDMTTAMTHQKDAVRCGFWPLYHYDPRLAHDHGRPFHLDSRKPSLAFRQFAMKEARFAMLDRSDPAQAERLFKLAQQDINDQWHYYEQMAGVEREMGTQPDAAQ